MDLLAEEELEKFPNGTLYLQSMLQALATLLIRRKGTSRPSSPRSANGLAPGKLRRVKERVEEGLDQDLSVSDLAQEAGLSSVYFSDMFRKSIGQTPHQYLMSRRIVRAKELLRSQQASILDVALSCGFKSQQHFSRAFRQFSSMTPKTFRDQEMR